MSSRFATLITAAMVLSMASAQMLVASPPVSGGAIKINEGPQHSANAAKSWVRAAISAMGGEEKLLSIRKLKLKCQGHTYLLEQSERPEGPWIVNYEEISEVRDLEGRRFRQEVVSRGPAAGPDMTSITEQGTVFTFTSGAQSRPVRSVPADDEWLALSPERVLFSALAATDIRAEGDVTLQGVSHHVVAFSWQQRPVRVFINIDTSLPTAIENVCSYPYDGFWSVWGDVRTRTYLSFWTLESGGVHYPRQWDVERNGQTYKAFSITELAVNPDVPNDSLTVPANVRQALASRKTTTIEERPLGRPDRPAKEIAPGVVQIPGAWNITLVKQNDGVVVIEAPISSGYSEKVIAEIARRFPNAPIKAVISTSDAWPHIGGVREYVSRGIPVYALDLNRPILERIVAAPHSLAPDSLSRAPRKPNFRILSRKTIIGSGPNALEIYPVRTETGERMLMVYLPDHRLLYGADLVQGPLPDGSFFMPQYLSELIDAARREKLDVETVFAMHALPTPWAKITAAVASASANSK